MPQGWTPVVEPTAAPSAWTPVPEAAPDFRATNEPPSTALKAAAYGKDALQLALDALPGAGAVVGGVLATPETAGAGTLVGSALGAGAGRGLRDLIAAGLGLQRPDTAIGEGKKIAVDTATTYAAGRILPALWAAIKTPGATVGDVYEGVRGINNTFPKLLRWNLPKLPPGVAKAPAAILERPAWQSWQDHLPEVQPSPQVARTTGTSMIPAAVPARGIVTPPPPIVTPPPVATAAPVPTAPTEFQAAQAARANALPDQRALNETALAARRAAYQASQVSAPAAEPIVAASGQMKLTAPEFKEFQRLLQQKGMTPAAALEEVKTMRALAEKFGLGAPTAADTRFPKGARR